MPYRSGSYCLYGNCSNCITGTYWFPGGGGDINDPVRNQITYAYLSLFGRYGETAGVEFWVNTWVYGGGPEFYGSIYNMVRAGGEGSGELASTQQFGKHTNMSTNSSCPISGCTDPNASNYNPNATVNDGSCTYISGCTDPAATNYNPNATISDGSCTYPQPTVSLTVSPSSIIRGQIATLYWSSTNTRSVSTNFGSTSISGSTTVSPTGNITYRITAFGTYGGSAIAEAVLRVYIPPVVTFTADRTTIVRGESTILRWTTTGDASTATVSPGIGSSNLSSFITISPTVTTTYTIFVSGLGGSDSDQITITVLQPPTVTLTGPTSIDYGQSATINYEATNVSQSFTVTPYYYDLDGVETIGNSITLPLGNNIEGSFTHTPPWGNRGPRQINYVATVVGEGGLTDTDSHLVNVNIDQMPNLIDIPESDDKIKNEDPVISPDIQVTTAELLVTGIDIPVPVKSDRPIQVQINNDSIWRDVEYL